MRKITKGVITELQFSVSTKLQNYLLIMKFNLNKVKRLNGLSVGRLLRMFGSSNPWPLTFFNWRCSDD